MRRFQLPAAVALLHAIATLAVIALALADFGRNFPHSPSIAGEVLGGLAVVLGFPLVSGAIHMGDFSLFFGPAWQSYALLAANSALWGVVAALLWRRAPGVRRGGRTAPLRG